jgi:hypothetical protein
MEDTEVGERVRINLEEVTHSQSLQRESDERMRGEMQKRTRHSSKTRRVLGEFRTCTVLGCSARGAPLSLEALRVGYFLTTSHESLTHLAILHLMNLTLS